MPHSFESLRQTIDELAIPPDHESRRVHWVLSGQLGVAADYRGGREVFVVGPRLVARSSIVAGHMEHSSWVGKHDAPFEATRLVLPGAPHFFALAALIASELVRLGLGRADRSAQDVFTDVEPLIELSLRRGLLSEDAIAGLAGELVVLEHLFASVSDHPELRSSVLDMWRGYTQSARDFLLGSAAVEVKTTTLMSSIHHIHSLSQVELDSAPEAPEAGLFLMSVGIKRAEQGALSVPILAERVMLRLKEAGYDSETLSPLQTRFIGDLRRYGSTVGAGYDHLSMQARPAYAVRFTTTFEPRLYDVCDPEFRVIRRPHLDGTFVSPDDISYKVVLPDNVSAENPVANWRQALQDLTRGALGL